MEVVPIPEHIYNSNSLQLDQFKKMNDRSAQGLNSAQSNQIK